MPTKESISRLMDHMQGPGAERFGALVMAALDETQGDLDGAIDMARMVMQQDGAKFSTEDGQWITIGGHADGEEKHKGGFPVFINSDGVILKGGPKGLRGKKVGETKAYFDGVKGKKKERPFSKPEKPKAEERPFAKVESSDDVQEIPMEIGSPEDAVPAPKPKKKTEPLPPASNDGDWATEEVRNDTPEGITSALQYDPQGDGMSDRLDKVYDQIKADVPSLTPKRWQAFLQKAWDDKAVELVGINEARQLHATPGALEKVLQKSSGSVDRVLAYAFVKDPAKLQRLVQDELLRSDFAKPEEPKVSDRPFAPPKR